MKCSKFEKSEQGLLSPSDFAAHVETCPDCSGAAALNRRLSEEAMKLRAPVSAPGLWDRIESALLAEAAGAARPVPSFRRPTRRRSFRPGSLLIPAAAVLLLVLVAIFRPAASVPKSGLMAQKALAEVEAREAEYLAAIEELERSARSKISAMDLTLMSLYRDRLSVIDSQIEKCREALAVNPANAHIRRYLMAALQDKKQTLAEALAS